MLVGIGESKTASLKVKWPSGKVFELADVSAGDLVMARENEQHPFTTETYLKESRPPERTSAKPSLGQFTLATKDSAANEETPIRVYTTMATWCESCLRNLPEVNAMCVS